MNFKKAEIVDIGVSLEDMTLRLSTNCMLGNKIDLLQGHIERDYRVHSRTRRDHDRVLGPSPAKRQSTRSPLCF